LCVLKGKNDFYLLNNSLMFSGVLTTEGIK
jgi:hypothetical protein